MATILQAVKNGFALFAALFGFGKSTDDMKFEEADQPVPPVALFRPTTKKVKSRRSHRASREARRKREARSYLLRIRRERRQNTRTGVAA